jgi:hypothetical protein
VDDAKLRTVALSEYVSATFGGTKIDPETLEVLVQEVVGSLKPLHVDGWVDLGDLIKWRLGLCRHRSILFKYLCDHMQRFPAQWGLSSATVTTAEESGACVVRGAIFCQLVRGMQSAPDGVTAKPENHMWNVVRLGSELFVVDVMQRPRELLATESKEAQAYQRAILAGVGNGAPQSQVSSTFALSFDGLH